MQSRNFRLQRVGNLNWLEQNYKFRSIAFSLDELIVLNASKGSKSIEEFAETVSLLVNDVFIPIAAGGGIRSMQDAEILFRNGADKIVLNSVLFENPSLVSELVKQYGAQSIVASVDYKSINNKLYIYINDGERRLDISMQDYLKHLISLDVGEIYLNSMDKDGTGFGYDLAIIEKIVPIINLPLIIAGGAGNETHLIQGLKINGVSAVATANLFNFIGDGLPIARKKIIQEGENLASWDDTFRHI